MEISEVRVKLVNNPNDRLKAFCSITLENDFVVRDLKIIDGANGTFVAMPSRKLADRCSKCGHKNHLRACYCNECGGQLPESRSTRRRAKLHADIAHPINSACRERIQDIVVEAFREEVEKSKQPGYKPARLDDYDDYDEGMHTEEEVAVSENGDANVDTVDTIEPADTVEAVEAVASEAEPPTADTNGRRPRDQKGNYDNGEGYSDLIAELKRDATGRRDTHNRRNRPPAPTPEAVEDGDQVVDLDDNLDMDVDVDMHVDTDVDTEPVEQKEEAVTSESAPSRTPTAHATSDDFGAGLL